MLCICAFKLLLHAEAGDKMFYYIYLVIVLLLPLHDNSVAASYVSSPPFQLLSIVHWYNPDYLLKNTPLLSLVLTYLLTCTCVGIHRGRVDPAPPIELTTSGTVAPQARRSCASSVETFILSFLHRA